MQNYTDEELISIYKTETGNRKHKAFDCLYIRYSKPLTRYFYFALQKDNEKAKDFYHDLILKILESPDKFDSDRQFKPWIYRIATNMCLNNYRKAAVIQKFTGSYLLTETSYSELNEWQADLKKSIQKLSHENRSLIVLRFKINLSIREMAEIYECPEGTIKSRLFYATRELAKFYKNL